MRSLAGLWAEDVAKRLPVPTGARDMLHLGGSHGYFSVCVCNMHRPGNPRTDDLGEISVDIVFLSQFVHHFSGRQNRAAMSRIAHRYVPAASA